jgi:hypothetical protein
MHSKQITKRLVDRLRPSDAEYFAWDGKLAGFGLRVQPTGAKTYVVKYRAGSGRGAPTRRVTLGRVGTLTPDEARALARKALGAVAHGSDPAALRAAERRASTLRELAEIFLAEHVEAKRKPTEDCWPSAIKQSPVGLFCLQLPHEPQKVRTFSMNLMRKLANSH